MERDGHSVSAAAGTDCVALVDDDASVRIALVRMLRLAGYEVSAFGSGPEFLASLNARLPDCLVLDVHMPSMSGFEVGLSLRKKDIHLPVIFITASDDTALDTSEVEDGTELLRKPFSKHALLGAVKAALLRSPGRTSV
jgi:FixJ family two-component response regulator